MEFEDSRYALFTEPNAYIQKKVETQSKKVIYREPYEGLPRYYENKEDAKKKEKATQEKLVEQSNNKPSFNFKNIMPLLSSFVGARGNNLLSSFMSNSGFDISKIVSLFAQNPSSVGSILNLFSKKKDSKNTSNCQPKETDFEIKNYTRVE